jgi:hypothetical protein
MYYQVCNKENKGPGGHDNQVQGLLVLASGNISKGNAKSTTCKGNLTNLRRELHLSLAKGNPK